MEGQVTLFLCQSNHGLARDEKQHLILHCRGEISHVAKYRFSISKSTDVPLKYRFSIAFHFIFFPFRLTKYNKPT